MTVSTRLSVLESRLNAQDVAIDRGLTEARARALIATAEAEAKRAGRTLTRRDILDIERKRKSE